MLAQSSPAKIQLLGSSRASAPATCGELLQGVIDGREFLVNSPINLFSTVNVALYPEGTVESERGEYGKTLKAIRLALGQFGEVTTGARVTVTSQVPRGKGLASSTSEIAAGIRATVAALGRSISPDNISKITIAVEPSDGVYHPGVTRYDHLRGQTLERLGNPPALAFAIVDCGGEVDTVDFDRERFRANARQNENEIRYAMSLLRRGFQEGNAALIAQGATISARSNQPVLFKPVLEDLVRGTVDVGGLGVNCAHTGTVLGVMFDPLVTSQESILERVGSLAGKENILGVHRLISGGTFVEEEQI